MSAGRKINGGSKEWGTPQKYVDSARTALGGLITLDPCSNQFSIVQAIQEYHFPERDGLVESWDFPTIFVNPPYGIDKTRKTSIKHWFGRCLDAHVLHGSEVLALVPVATNTRHWKDFVFGKASRICFLYDTRLRFLVDGKDEGKGAPMACAMIYWGKFPDRFESEFSKHGAVLRSISTCHPEMT